MLARLATFLRFSLDNDPEQKIRLNDEIKALNALSGYRENALSLRGSMLNLILHCSRRKPTGTRLVATALSGECYQVRDCADGDRRGY